MQKKGPSFPKMKVPKIGKTTTQMPKVGGKMTKMPKIEKPTSKPMGGWKKKDGMVY